MDLSGYLDLFVAEAREHLASAHDLNRALEDGAESGERLRELFRHLHSVKGMAASMGYGAMSALAHDAESLMERLRDGARPPSAATRIVLGATLSCLERMVDAAAEKAPRIDDVERAPLQVRLARLLGSAAVEASAHDPGGHARPGRSGPEDAAGCVKLALILKRGHAFPAVRAALVLGRLARWGRIVRTEPPMAALRTGRFDGRLLVTLVTESSVRTLAANVAALDDVSTFTLAPDEIPADPARERAPAPSLRVRADRLDALLEDTLALMNALGRLEGQAAPRGGAQRPDDVLLKARRTARRLYDRLVDVRLVPFEIAARRLDRAAQELARRLGKPLRFEVRGGDVRLDRGLLDGLMDPLLHMVRNAIDHGLEAPPERAARRKRPEGRVRVGVERLSARTRVVVEDDGRGLDARTLKQAAVDRGVLTPTEAMRLSDDEALRIVTLPGFSTAASATEVSGRGVGMDVVRTAVETLGGRLTIEAKPGRGSRFELSFPNGVSLVTAYLVRAGRELFAVPLTALARIGILDDQNTVWRDGRRYLAEGDTEIPVRTLAERLGLDGSEADGPTMTLLVEGPHGVLGFAVEDVAGCREIVMRPLPAPLDAHEAFLGAASLDDGTIAPVLDLRALT